LEIHLKFGKKLKPKFKKFKTQFIASTLNCPNLKSFCK